MRGRAREVLRALRVASLFVVALLLAVDASAWWNTSWSHRRKLLLDSAEGSNLTSFPVLVILTPARIDYNKTQSLGQDLRFVDADDGTLLAHEIERWTPGGTSYVWVNVPQVDGGSTTDFIWMYYGNSAAADGQNLLGTWPGYNLVQHLDETSGAHVDSAIADGVSSNSSSIAVAAQGSTTTGLVAGHDQFVAGNGDQVMIATSPTLDAGLGESLTVEAWVRSADLTNWQHVVSKEPDGSNTEGGFELSVVDGTVHFSVGDTVPGPDELCNADSASPITTGAWYYIAGRYNRGNGDCEVFVDGVNDGGGNNGAIGTLANSQTLGIGGESDGSPAYFFDGRIDEVRLSKNLKSDAWLRAQNRSIRDNGFVTFGPEAAQCCGLVVTETATEIFVNGPNRFDMRFNLAKGGGMDRFIDAEEDTGTDLAGGIDTQEALFTAEAGYLAQGYTTGDNGEGARLDLLEATTARVKVRQEASYARDAATPRAIPGIKGFGDYSIYGIGRMATAWETRATVNTTATFTQLQFSVYYPGTPPLDSWTGWSGTGFPVFSPFASDRRPGTDAFVLAQSEKPDARTDFLSIIAQDWTQANNTYFGFSDPRDWEEVSWIDDDAANFLASSRTRWNFLTYFKPTTLAGNADAAVTSRANDYRTPGTTVLSKGSGWVDAAENTASDPANVFFNEAEGAYALEIDLGAGQGLSFAMDGSATTRYRPFFKVRRWRSFVEAPAVTFDADGPGGAAPAALVKDVDYRAAVKPFARAHRTNILAWHCSAQDAASCTPPGLDVGNGGSLTSGGSFVTGRFGRGFSVAAATDYIQASGSDFSQNAGAVEFWFRPTYDSTAGGNHMLWWNRGSTSQYDCYRFEHTGGQLVFEMVNNASNIDCAAAGATGPVRTVTVTGASYSWSAHEWVHLRTEWSAANGLKVLVNGREVGNAPSFVLSSFQAGATIFGSCDDSTFVCPGGGAARHADGIIDEPTVYEDFGGSGTTPQPLAHAGLVADSSEYLARGNLNTSLITTPVAAGRKGVYLFFGADSKFSAINMTFQTLGIGASVSAGALVWQYWSDNGAGTEGWLSLEAVSGFADGTNDFKQRGAVAWNGNDALLANWKPYSVNGSPELYYVRVYLAGAAAYTTPAVENVVKTDILLFQFCKDVTAANQIFAFSVPTTEVTLESFGATAGDRSVLLKWQTASELRNLGFHVYRGLSSNGPWTRLTTALIPGLGSSAVGQAYSFRDDGLANGTRYFYRLEDVDASSKVTSHGPVSAVPVAGAVPSDGGSGATTGKKTPAAASCPAWVLQAYGSSTGSDPGALSLRCTRHGDPEALSLQELSRDSRSATLELRTGGFYALHEPSGAVRVYVPGYEFGQDEQASALPIRRVLTDAVVGRQVRLGGVRALDVERFALLPSVLGKSEMRVGRDGTVRAVRRSIRERDGGSDVQRELRGRAGELVKLLPSQFQGEKKSAALEIAPLRYEALRRQLVLAKRVRVKLLFTGREAGESGRGGVGRAPGRKPRASGEVLARLYTSSPGLYGVTFEELFAGARGYAASQLRLERQGEAVGFHVEPAGEAFGPGSRLYFVADREAGSTEYSGELAYELIHARGGLRMALQPAAPGGAAVKAAPVVKRVFETNRYYQPGLLEAPDVWLWDAASSGATRVQSVTLDGVAATGTGELEVFLQGASESGQAVDHHVSVSVNGVLAGEAQFAGKKPYRMSLSVGEGVLREGSNEVSLVNVGDTGVTSLVFLDRFTIAHPQSSSLADGRFSGEWPESGSVSLETSGAVSGPVRVVDVTGPSVPGESGPASASVVPVWLTGVEVTAGAVRFRVEAGHRYRVESDSALFSPRVSQPEPSTLKAEANQADWLLIAPRAFLAAAEPLVARRAAQGLVAKAVAFEEIAAEFGHGQASAEAIRGFIAHAYHSWSRPSPRYVVLLGDTSYDPRNFTGISTASPLPALWTKTSYLWTASDPLIAAVNGSDTVPDLAIGRLPATTVAQAEALVQKLIAWEDSGQGLSGAAALVADNPDVAGDFEWDVDDIRASYLGGREANVLKLSELGAELRPRVREAFDAGLSYLSYVGHGGAAVWASENVWNSWDAASLQPQSQQPLLLTMNCLNGYFVAPSFESLSESLVKAEGRGAIASISPSGLSLDGPAHQYHRALMAELVSGRHERLGDAIAAAQKTYATSGLMPELLDIYHLLGDPATRIR